MTTPYELGRCAEYTVKRMLEGMGYRWIIRSAASHTPIDLLASDGNNILAVQCKVRGYLNPEDRKMLLEWADRFKPMLAGKKKGRWRLEVPPSQGSGETVKHLEMIISK